MLQRTDLLASWLRSAVLGAKVQREREREADRESLYFFAFELFIQSETISKMNSNSIEHTTTTNSSDLTSRVGLIHTESQKVFLVSSHYEPPLDGRNRPITDESSLGTWGLFVATLTDPSDDESKMEWWGLGQDEGEDLVKEVSW